MAEKTYSNSVSGISGGMIAITCNDNNSDILNDISSCLTTSSIIGWDNTSVMNTSQISGAQSETSHSNKLNLNKTHNIGQGSCRFPKLEECAHFHYERVKLGKIIVRLIEDRSDIQSSGYASQYDTSSQNRLTLNTSNSSFWCIIKVCTENYEPFLIRRSIENIKMLDEMLHRCIYDRKISGLQDLSDLDTHSEQNFEHVVSVYLNRFSNVVSDSLTCGPILTWFQLDNKGRRLPLAEPDTVKSINTPAVGAAYGVRRYVAQACDEISIEVGDMISVIDMPSPAESTWWRGKRSHVQKSHYEVGFFPQSCVATIGDKVPRHVPLPAPLVGSLAVSPTKPVLRKHGKLIAFFRMFILSRPSRRRLKQTGIYKERVFSCDLSEHLLNSGQDIPMVLKCCAEFIEEHGIVDGIYRLSGITSNIQKLRRAFDEERVPDLTQPEIKQDIHALSSLLKMYFRELPNPLCTYQLYEKFVDAIQTKDGANDRLRLMKETVQKLPPPHYRTLKYLSVHLNKISHQSAKTGMTDRNLAIVWAPNLLRSPALEAGGVAALRGVGVQAVVTEYLITNCGLIFDDASDDFGRNDTSLQYESFTDTESIHIEHREYDPSISLITERPKSLSVGGPKLISLEEAQTRHNRLEFSDIVKSAAIDTPAAGCSSYIEVGGGPSSLPDKYHTVLPVPRSWQKRKTHSWKSLFTRTPRSSNSNHDIKSYNTTKGEAQKHTITISGPCNLGDVHEKNVKLINLRDGQDKLNKSIEILDGSKLMDVCVRSNSIDSLRTVGHSRSVSHDSYFDLLQSPLKAMNCPSREYSELGLNFDREEPEMRIFSESESLVSSPKVQKEICRRIISKSKPDDCANIINSVNPSPKKQPRLNISANVDIPNWQVNTNNESMCKRYKLEDQLSEIQYIDCTTPEHTNNFPPNTIYAKVQVHNPPLSQIEQSDDLRNIGTKFQMKLYGDGTVEPRGRLSYPVTKYGNRSVSYLSSQMEERVSYPCINNKYSTSDSDNSRKYVCCVPVNINESQKRSDEEANNICHETLASLKTLKRLSYSEATKRSENSSLSSNGCVSDKNVNVILRCSSAADVAKKFDMECSRLSILTPSSPVHSPRYSLLVGETSSENSSSMNTPIYDVDVSSTIIGHTDRPGSKTSIISDNQPHHVIQRTNQTKDFSTLPPEDSWNNVSQLENTTPDALDMVALKRDLSLDLDGSKMSVDDVSLTSKHVINIPSTPNTPNYTQTSSNTSQSMTPSEFGYQNFNRQSNVVSLEGSPKSDIYESIDMTCSTYSKPTKSQNHLIGNSSTDSKANQSPSPLKSRINITYSLKSPSKCNELHNTSFFEENNESVILKKNSNDDNDYEIVNLDDRTEGSSDKTLLETSFDETMVYEQVKFYKGAISEVNDLLNNGNNTEKDYLNVIASTDDITILSDPLIYSTMEVQPSTNEVPTQIVPEVNQNESGICTSEEVNRNNIAQDCNDQLIIDSDVPMCDQDINIQDSLELDQHLSLYENVELKKPVLVYENIDLKSEISIALDKRKVKILNDAKLSLSDKISQKEVKPGSLIVRQLANKFELSPIDIAPPFDFTKSHAQNSNNNRNFPCVVKVKNSKQLQKMIKITRSLDENAFVREFGSSHKKQEYVTKSSQQLLDIANNILTEDTNLNRRMSFEYTRPKSLNPPKRLANLQNLELDEICKKDNSTTIKNRSILKLDLNLTKDNPEDVELPSALNREIHITPTTENPISLIQHNVMELTNPPTNDNGRCQSNSVSFVKVLSSFKLDRERIDKIKEERRHQLNEKFRSESFKSEKEYYKTKSKSKTELRDIDHVNVQNTSMRFKSKSRSDIPSVQELQHYAAKELKLDCDIGGIKQINEKNQTDNEKVVSRSNSNTTINEEPTVLAKSINKSVKHIDIRDVNLRDRNSGKCDRIIGGTPFIVPTSIRSTSQQHDRISPQFSIRDMTAMFESRSHNH